jgi:hypothetical protein
MDFYRFIGTKLRSAKQLNPKNPGSCCLRSTFWGSDYCIVPHFCRRSTTLQILTYD